MTFLVASSVCICCYHCKPPITSVEATANDDVVEPNLIFRHSRRQKLPARDEKPKTFFQLNESSMSLFRVFLWMGWSGSARFCASLIDSTSSNNPTRSLHRLVFFDFGRKHFPLFPLPETQTFPTTKHIGDCCLTCENQWNEKLNFCDWLSCCGEEEVSGTEIDSHPGIIICFSGILAFERKAVGRGEFCRKLFKETEKVSVLLEEEDEMAANHWTLTGPKCL